MLPAWPKGPFPEKYTARAVHARLEGAWDDEVRRAAVARVRALGLVPHPAQRDPITMVFLGEAELEVVRVALAGAPVTAFAWRAGNGDDRSQAERGASAIALCPSADPIDALVAIGVASPQHGIGTAALVRFVTTLRGVAHDVCIDELAEDGLVLALTPKSAEAARRIAVRARELCAPLATRCDEASVHEALETEHRLALSWP